MASLKEKAARAAQNEETGPFNALRYFGSDEERILDIPLEQIYTDPTQPRDDLGDIESLKFSIQEHGLLQPILVSPTENKTYQIIAGERRFTAAKSLGYRTIKALVRTIEDHQRLEIQLVENIQRKDLNALEEAQSYKRLIAEFGMTQENLAKRLGKTQAAINQSLRLLELPQSMKDDYKTSYNSASPVTKSLLLEIAKQPSEEKQNSMWEQAKQGKTDSKKSARGAASKIAENCSDGAARPNDISLSYSDADRNGHHHF